jgi:hypothetical protein
MKNVKMTNKTLHRKLKNPTPLKTITYHYMFLLFQENDKDEYEPYVRETRRAIQKYR